MRTRTATKTRREKVSSHFATIGLLCLASAFRAWSADCVSPPAGLVAWWAGEGNANDSANGNNGTLLNGTSFAPGEVRMAFSFDGISNAVRVPASANLNVGTSNGLTLEAWVNPTDVGPQHPVIEWSQDVGGAPYGVHLWIGHDPDPPGYFFANIVDTSGNWHVINSAPGLVQPNVFQHIAVTYDKTSGLARLFLNGAVVRETNLGMFTPQTTYNLYFGERPPGDFNSSLFAGLIDEIGVYGRALDTNEIAAIYAAGSAGKCGWPTITQQPQSQIGYWGKSIAFTVGAVGVPSLIYQWQKDGVAIPGATGSSLVLTNLQMTDAGNYSVVISNALGSTTSRNAYLTMNPAGVSVALYAGVTIDGVVGLTYGIQSTTDLSNTNGWRGMANVTLDTRRELWFDVQPATQPQRYYRIMPGPIPIP
jgi:hypothetical protein